MAARARRPRKTDCDPSMDFNLCADEREYSIETARRPEPYVIGQSADAGVLQPRDADASDTVEICP
jgi:hypothetical protein